MSSRGGPGEHPVDADIATTPDHGYGDRAVTSTAVPPKLGEVWPGRRRLNIGERVGVSVVGLAVAGYLIFFVVSVDWVGRPALGALAVFCAVASLGFLASSFWAQRPNRPVTRGSSLRELAGPVRRALRRDLRAGRPGPPELRPYAVTWTCQGLQPPWTQAPLLATPALIAGGMAGEPTAPRPLGLVMLGVALTLAVYSMIDWAVRRRAAVRVADALDRLTPPPAPPLPDPA